MPPKSLLVIFGATGNQGFSTAHSILTSPTLSTTYSVRALTRSPSSPKAQTLASLGAEIHHVDLDDPSTLAPALKGAHTVFALTTTTYDGATWDAETRQGRALVDEAVAQGVQHIIWSSLPSPRWISGGKLKEAVHFDVKFELETYIRGLPVKSSFFAPASFMQNFLSNQRPREAGDGTFVLALPMPGSTVWPLIDIRDTGAWVCAMLEGPGAFEGRMVCAAEGLYTVDEIVATMSKVSGKVVRHVEVGDEEFKGYLPEATRGMLTDMFLFVRDYGYYGAETEREVRWGKERAIGKVTGLEEFLKGVGFTLG